MSPSVSPLFRRFLVKAILPWAALLWVTSFANWHRSESFDRIIEIELVAAALWLAHVVHRDCSRSVMEYVGALPIARPRALAAPFSAAAGVLVVLALLVHLHESLGAAWLETRVLFVILGADSTGLEFRSRPFHPWLGLWGLPLAAFWSNVCAVRSRTLDRLGSGMRRPAPRAIAAALLAAVPCVVAVGIVDSLGVAPWPASVLGAALLLLAWLVRSSFAGGLDSLATDDFPVRERPWQS